MDYQKLLIRSWEIIWKNKFLIFLGVLVLLGSWESGGSSWRFSESSNGFDLPPFEDGFDIPIYTLILVGIAIFVGLAIWALSTISRGGLIYGADKISKGQITNFADSFSAAWKKGWRLIGINLIPASPVILIAVIAVGFYLNRTVVFHAGHVSKTANAAIILPIVLAIVLLASILSLLSAFANRACMLENLGIIHAYSRGWQVLGRNLGAAVVLFFLQILISIGIGLILLLPGIVISLCCFLWPILLFVQGTITAYFSTLWTLSWNQWTGSAEAQHTRLVM